METQMSTRAKIISLVKGSLFFICFYAATPYSDNPLMAARSHAYDNLRFLYLTHISLYITLLTFAVGFVYRIKRKLFSLYNALIPLSFALEFIVTSTFWAMYYHNPFLIKSKMTKDPLYKTPVLTELGQHLLPFVLIILEQLDIPVQRSKLHDPVIVIFCILWYTAISVASRFKNNVYLYPFMNKEKYQKIRYGLLLLFIIACYAVQKIYIRIKTRKNK